MGFSGHITVYLNDHNPDIIMMLDLLLSGRGGELAVYPDYVKCMCAYRAGVSAKPYKTYTDYYNKNMDKYLQLFDKIHTSFEGVEVILTT
jgi:hypothetical protein